MWFVDSSARDRAAAETGLPEDTFPTACPFTLDQLTGNRLPDEQAAR